MAEYKMQYGDFAQYYDLLMNDVDYENWCSHVDERIKNSNVSSKEMLEMACGTGNISVNMAKLGYNVTAFDISDEMLSIAFGKAIEKGVRIKFLHQDMKSIDIKDKFGAIICLCDSINYITDKTELFKIFKWVCNHLTIDGMFIFDINSSYKLKNIIGNNTFTHNEDDVAYIWENTLTDEGTVEFDITFFVKEGKLYRRFEELHTERVYENDEIEKMLREAGFNNIDICEAFSYKKAAEKTERIAFYCKKA